MPERQPGQYVLPISAAILVVGVLMMLCSPLTALALVNRPPPPAVAALPEGQRPPPPPVRPVDAAAVVVFFGLGVLGMAGGFLGVLRLVWGRWLMLAFSGLTLLYLAAMVTYRLTGGLEDVFETAPTGSAVGAFLVWTVVPLALVAALLVVALRHLSRPDVAATFRRARFG